MLSSVKLRITQFRCLRSYSVELSTSSHSRPVFITILFLQPRVNTELFTTAYGVNSLYDIHDTLAIRMGDHKSSCLLL